LQISAFDRFFSMACFIYLVFICTFILLFPTVKMLDPAFVKIEEKNED